MLAKKTLELNPHHSVMKEMLQRVKDASDGKLGEEIEDNARLLFHMALLNSGFNIEDPSDFATSLGKLINSGFGLKRDEPVKEIEVELEEESKSDEADSTSISLTGSSLLRPKPELINFPNDVAKSLGSSMLKPEFNKAIWKRRRALSSISSPNLPSLASFTLWSISFITL
jgi:hypothetical protein